MSNGNAKWTAGERVARDFVGPHPTLARRIDAAIARAVKAETHRMYEVAWHVYEHARDLTGGASDALRAQADAPTKEGAD